MNTWSDKIVLMCGRLVVKTMKDTELINRIKEEFLDKDMKANPEYINEFVQQFDIEQFKKQVLEHDNEIRLLQESFNKLSTKEKINHIFYNGQIYDAYSLLIDILNKAKKEIIIIDNYAGKELFDITKDIK